MWVGRARSAARPREGPQRQCSRGCARLLQHKKERRKSLLSPYSRPMLVQSAQLVLAGLTVGTGYALVALGIHIILRATRVINFAQGEFVIVGGLVAYSFVNTL